MNDDIFRPRTEPYRTLYDALLAKAEQRGLSNPDVWIPAEREAMWQAARDYAQKHGLRVPTMAEVEQAERSAVGHCDYAAQFAYGVGRAMQTD